MRIWVFKDRVRINDVNRRGRTPKGSVDLRPNPKGIVDEEVGVTRITEKYRLLTNYACHPVVLSFHFSRLSLGFARNRGASRRRNYALHQCLLRRFESLVHNGNFRDVARLGKTLVQEVIRVGAGISNFSQPEIRMKEAEVLLPWENRFFGKELKEIIRIPSPAFLPTPMVLSAIFHSRRTGTKPRPILKQMPCPSGPAPMKS